MKLKYKKLLTSDGTYAPDIVDLLFGTIETELATRLQQTYRNNFDDLNVSGKIPNITFNVEMGGDQWVYVVAYFPSYQMVIMVGVNMYDNDAPVDLISDINVETLSLANSFAIDQYERMFDINGVLGAVEPKPDAPKNISAREWITQFLIDVLSIVDLQGKPLYRVYASYKEYHLFEMGSPVSKNKYMALEHMMTYRKQLEMLNVVEESQKMFTSIMELHGVKIHQTKIIKPSKPVTEIYITPLGVGIDANVPEGDSYYFYDSEIYGKGDYRNELSQIEFKTVLFRDTPGYNLKGNESIPGNTKCIYIGFPIAYTLNVAGYYEKYTKGLVRALDCINNH